MDALEDADEMLSRAVEVIINKNPERATLDNTDDETAAAVSNNPDTDEIVDDVDAELVFYRSQHQNKSSNLPVEEWAQVYVNGGFGHLRLSNNIDGYDDDQDLVVLEKKKKKKKDAIRILMAEYEKCVSDLNSNQSQQR